MSNSEVWCASCAHKEVCRYRNSLYEEQVHLSDLKFIKLTSLECIHYDSKKDAALNQIREMTEKTLAEPVVMTKEYKVKVN